MLSEKTKLILVAIASFLLGVLFFWTKNKISKGDTKKVEPEVDVDKDKTIAHEENGKYFLVFNSVVVLTRSVSKEQYDSFISQYPLGKAEGNVIDKFSDVPNKYTTENGKYFESIWNGAEFGKKLEITKEEFDFYTKSNGVLDKYISKI